MLKLSLPNPFWKKEASEAAEEAGSYSPQMLHGDENEEAIDPEEDKAILVNFLYVVTYYLFFGVLVNRI